MTTAAERIALHEEHIAALRQLPSDAVVPDDLLASIVVLAQQGICQRDAAKKLGITPTYLCVYAKRHGIVFQHASGWRSGVSVHAEEIATLYRAGRTLQEIGVQFGVTRERIRQVLRKYTDVTARDGGAASLASIRQLARVSARDEWARKKHGCTFREYTSLRGRITKAFIEQRNNARTHNIVWDLRLWEWWTIWQESGHWNERGRGGGYWMARRDTSKPYTADNVWIASGCDVASAWQRRRQLVGATPCA